MVDLSLLGFDITWCTVHCSVDMLCMNSVFVSVEGGSPVGSENMFGCAERMHVQYGVRAEDVCM